MNVKVYERDIDAGHGYQQLVFVDGKCISQTLHSKTGGWYTGDGDPDFIGQSPRQIGMKANRFKRWTNRERERDFVYALLAEMDDFEHMRQREYPQNPL
jgi:hypothetical protein